MWRRTCKEKKVQIRFKFTSCDIGLKCIGIKSQSFLAKSAKAARCMNNFSIPPSETWKNFASFLCIINLVVSRRRLNWLKSKIHQAMVEVFAIWLLVIFNIYLGSTEFYIFREKKVSRGQKQLIIRRIFHESRAARWQKILQMQYVEISVAFFLFMTVSS